MKVKVGQWARTQNGVLGDITYIYRNRITSTMRFDEFESDCKVADTPQELIQVGDLVHTLIVPIGVVSNIRIKEGLYWVNGFMASNRISEITKILTPNNKGGYDLQWEVEDEKI